MTTSRWRTSTCCRCFPLARASISHLRTSFPTITCSTLSWRRRGRGGVKVYEYEPTFLHAKYGVIEGKWSIIGSPNLNFRSRELDEENGIGIYEEALGAKLKETFAKDLEKSKQMNLEDWRQRNPPQKLFETVSRVLDQQS
ncbi:MAG TPA: phospholipase D-like domain-containing protein [Vicinamibacterales bacterium]|nr:phospholipase D-like domain-containing protein [Vicinamibacterales bacterium]